MKWYHITETIIVQAIPVPNSKIVLSSTTQHKKLLLTTEAPCNNKIGTSKLLSITETQLHQLNQYKWPPPKDFLFEICHGHKNTTAHHCPATLSHDYHIPNNNRKLSEIWLNNAIPLLPEQCSTISSIKRNKAAITPQCCKCCHTTTTKDWKNHDRRILHV